jgi:uncharacterized protein (DUF4415 family)
MTGSKTNLMTRNEILAAIKAIPPSKDFIWDGADEDDRPATAEELNMALNLANNQNTQILFAVDNAVLQAFRATGENWQNAMNDALKEWLKFHAVVG